MSKKAKFRRIISNKYYYSEELAECVESHKRSIYDHIKKGLPALTDRIPYLIYGADAKEYFKELYSRDKVKLGPNEIQCHGCRSVISIIDTPVKIISTGQLYSQEKIQVQILGICPKCKRKFSRLFSFITKRTIERGIEIPIGEYTQGGKK